MSYLARFGAFLVKLLLRLHTYEEPVFQDMSVNENRRTNRNDGSRTTVVFMNTR